jgi:hypothetical protein
VDEQWAAGPRAIIVDLSQVRAVRIEGLTVLVGLAVRAGEADLGLCLVDGERRLLVRRLEEAGLPDLFAVYATVDDALASLRPVTMGVATSSGLVNVTWIDRSLDPERPSSLLAVGVGDGRGSTVLAKIYI